MREFNTSGPCDPDKHYTLMRQSLLAKGQGLVDRGRFFTIFAPRQSGKTTYFQLLFRQLSTSGYLPIWISFEGLKTLERLEFYAALQHRLQHEFSNNGIQAKRTLKHQFDLEIWLEEASKQAQPLVLVIDEFEDIPLA